METENRATRLKIYNMSSADGIHFLLRDDILLGNKINIEEENDKRRNRYVNRMEGIAFLFVPQNYGIKLQPIEEIGVSHAIRVWDSNTGCEKGSSQGRNTGFDVMEEYFSRKSYPEVPSLRPEVYIVSDDYPDREALLQLLEKEDPKGKIVPLEDIVLKIH